MGKYTSASNHYSENMQTCHPLLLLEQQTASPVKIVLRESIPVKVE